MTGRIPQHFIDELMQRADIVELIGARVPLKKAGREYKACCPFHGEKTPSFTVSPTKGFYHCFGCGAHGTALGFLMEYDRLEFVDAVEQLASHLGLDVPREQDGPREAPLAPLYDALARAATFFESALRKSDAAVDYLRGRGLTGETAATFRIGYAPAGWDALLSSFPDTEAEREKLLAAGLVAVRDSGGHYDRFRDRIMFPIRDSRGRVCGFGGRVLGQGEPKYLNSPETAVFHKGQELYGLYEAKQAERKLARLLVVEGYMDVVSLAQHGVRDVVATLGTATTGEHVRRLFRVVPELVYCFDGDRAGRAAAWRALQVSLPEIRDGRQIRFLFLPDGEDPDSLVRREGAAAFNQRLGGGLPLSDYLLEELQRQAGSDSLDGRARLAELAKPLVQAIPPGVYRELLTERLAATVGLPRARLASALGQAGEDPGVPRRAPVPPRARTVPGGRPSLVRQAITHLVNYPQLGATTPVPAGLAAVQQRGASLLNELLELTRTHPGLSPGALVERFRGRPEGPHLEEILTLPQALGPEAAGRELADSLDRLVAADRQERMGALFAKGEQLTPAEKDELRRLQRDPGPGVR
jgi:DNA primase